MEKLKEHRRFRNQLIFMTIIMIGMGVFLAMPFEFLSEDAIEGSATLIGFGIVIGLLAIFNIFTYRENKKDYEKIK